MISRKLLWFLSIFLISLVSAVAYISLLPILDKEAFQAICIPSSKAEICYHQPQVLSEQSISAIAISLNQKTLVSGEGHNIQIWDVQTGKLQRTLQGHRNWITALAISPNQQILASSSLDRTIKLWNLVTGQLLKTLDSGPVTALQFNPNDTPKASRSSSQLASGSRFEQWSDGTTSQSGVQLWDITMGKVVDRLGTGAIKALQYSPDGQTLALINQEIELWQVQTGALLHRLKGNDTEASDVKSVTFSHDGQHLISGSDKIKVWQVHSGKLLQKLDFAASDLALSQDEELLVASIGDVITFWQLPEGKKLGLLPGSNYSGLFIDFALNSRVLVTGSTDGLRLWRSS